MQVAKIDLKNLTDESIDTVIDALKKGKVIVYPTDTIYGMGCLAVDEKAILKIYINMPVKKPIRWLCIGVVVVPF